MKGFLITLFLMVWSVPALFAARAQDLNSRMDESYVDTGVERSIEITLSGTPGNLTTVTLPAGVKGFRVYPRGANTVRFCVDYANATRTCAAVATDSDGTVAAADLAVGGIAKPELWETRLLPPHLDAADRRVQLRSTAASVVVDFEVF